MTLPLILAALLSTDSATRLPVPAALQDEPHVKLSVEGWIGTRSVSFNGGSTEHPVLELPYPIEIHPGRGEPGLSGVAQVELLVWSDRAGEVIYEHLGKRVRVECALTVTNMWGYMHASCSPHSIELAPNNSSKPTPLRGAA